MISKIIEKIRKELKETNMTSQSTETYKCHICRDVGWEQLGDNTLKKCMCTKIDYIKKCWENYGIKPQDAKQLKDYADYNKICSTVKVKAIKYATSFDEIKNKENNWFGLFGQPGAGKSYVAIGIGAELLNRPEKPIPVVYMPYVEVMRELKANARDDEEYMKLSTRYQRAKVLIIDDLFKDKINKDKIVYELKDTDMKHIYPIINYRYLNKLPTIISSECTPNMLLQLDEALGSRILEMCGDNMTVFKGAEFNYRLRKFGVKEAK